MTIRWKDGGGIEVLPKPPFAAGRLDEVVAVGGEAPHAEEEGAGVRRASERDILARYHVEISTLAWVLTAFNLALALSALPAAFLARRRPVPVINLASGRERPRQSLRRDVRAALCIPD